MFRTRTFQTERALQWVEELALIALANICLVLSAQTAVRLPFTPVPITAQTLAVLMAGALLGRRRGALAVLAYLAEGAAGLPVFAGGAGGLPYMLGPTGGYLAGFLLAAYVAGWLKERCWDRRLVPALGMLALGNLTIYLPGLLWLARFVGPEKALALGFFPFLIGDALKLALGAPALLLARRRR